MRQPADDEKEYTVRGFLMELEKGHSRAMAQRFAVEAGVAEVPEVPEALEELWYKRFMVLDGMREVGPDGPVRFTPGFLRDARELFDWEMLPSEALALHRLDLVVMSRERPRFPWDDDDDADEEA